MFSQRVDLLATSLFCYARSGFATLAVCIGLRAAFLQCSTNRAKLRGERHTWAERRMHVVFRYCAQWWRRWREGGVRVNSKGTSCFVLLFLDRVCSRRVVTKKSIHARAQQAHPVRPCP